MSHENADANLGNQVAETNALQRLARELGAVGSSGFEAGFGGSVWALVRTDEAEAFAVTRRPCLHGDPPTSREMYTWGRNTRLGALPQAHTSPPRIHLGCSNLTWTTWGSFGVLGLCLCWSWVVWISV